MLKCAICGYENNDDTKFCGNCGTKLGSPASGVTSDKASDDKLSKLSASKTASPLPEVSSGRPTIASGYLDPIDDPYWDDVLPEIDNELNSIPKDTIVKVAGCVVALFIIIAWLIYML